MTTPTPRTNAHLTSIAHRGMSRQWVRTGFARQLERDLAAAKAELASVKAHAEAMHKWIDRVLSWAERAEQDIGGEELGTILPDGGPIYEAYRAARPKDAQ